MGSRHPEGCIRKNSRAAWIGLQPKNCVTNNENIGHSQSVIKIPIGRKLTSGEINMCRDIFRDSIDYDAVRIIEAVHPNSEADINRNAVQGKRVAPDVRVDPTKPYIFCPPKSRQWGDHVHFYREDFSRVIDSEKVVNESKMLLIHEMAHIWQRNRGKFLLGTPVLEVRDGKTYDIYHISFDRPVKDFSLYNHEQQADLLALYYLYFCLKKSINQIKQTYVLKATERFFKDPKKMDLLPYDAKDRRER